MRVDYGDITKGNKPLKKACVYLESWVSNKPGVIFKICYVALNRPLSFFLTKMFKWVDEAIG